MNETIKYAYICSPYRATSNYSVKEHIKFAEEACRIIYDKGYIPIAPHLYFTRFLDDDKPAEREIGLKLGMELLKKCDRVFVFPLKDDKYQYGISDGMMAEINLAIKSDIYVSVEKMATAGGKNE